MRLHIQENIYCSKHIAASSIPVLYNHPSVRLGYLLCQNSTLINDPVSSARAVTKSFDHIALDTTINRSVTNLFLLVIAVVVLWKDLFVLFIFMANFVKIKILCQLSSNDYWLKTRICMQAGKTGVVLLLTSSSVSVRYFLTILITIGEFMSFRMQVLLVSRSRWFGS